MRHLRKSFVEGLVVFLPFALTVYALFAIFRFLYNLLAFGRDIVPGRFTELPRYALLVDLGTLLFSLLFVLLVGAVGRTLIGKAAIHWFSLLLQRIPLVSTIYSGLRQIFDMLFRQPKSLFTRPVAVPFPSLETRAIGFITGAAGSELPEAMRPKYLRVFVPSVPNPTSGFVLLYREEDVVYTDLTSEEVAKLILSGGILQEDARPGGRR